MDPREIAKLQADRNQIRGQIYRQQIADARVKKLTELPADYVGYDAETERHLVTQGDTVKAVTQNLTNAGLSAGQPVEFIDGAMDSTPVVRRPGVPEPVPPAPEPKWAVVLKHRRFVRTQIVYEPARPERYSDPVPALWYMTYISTTVQTEARENWNPLPGRKRYTEGYSIEMCGPASDFNDDPYCRRGFGTIWNRRVDEYFTQVNFFSGYCHLGLAGSGTLNSGEIIYFRWGGVVIATLEFSPDGLSAMPAEASQPLPEVFYKNSGETCEYGLENDTMAPLDMGWELLEVLPLTDYQPPRLIDPGYPGGSTPVDLFETVYWLWTNQGLKQVAIVQDSYLNRASGYPPSVDALASIDEQGTFYLDLRIERLALNEFEVFVTEVNLEHYQGEQFVTESVSWRRNWANYVTQPSGLTYSHPCVDRFDADKTVNIAERDGRMFRTVTPTLAEIQEGVAVSTEIFRLAGGATTCDIFTPDETTSFNLPPFDVALLEMSEKDSLQVESVVYYVEG